MFSKLTHDTKKLLQKKEELEESSENLKEKIEFIERERADINNKIHYIMKKIEQEQNLLQSKYDALSK